MTDIGRLGLREGWMAATSSLVLGVLTAAVIAGSTPAYPWVVTRGALIGLAVLLIGVAVGSERVIGLSAAPMLASALLGATSSDSPAWGRSMVIGILWYVTLELAWASIEQRDGSQRMPAVDRQRLREVATVVLLGLGVASVGVAASTLSPERTLILRALVLTVVLSALLAAARHLGATGAIEND